MHDEKEHVLSWIGLSSIPGVGRATYGKLVSHFASAERSLAASPGDLKDIEGLSSEARLGALAAESFGRTEAH